MPGTYRRTQTSKSKDSELKMRIISALNEAKDGELVTTDWIKSHDIALSPYTPQKLARICNNLVEMGVVVKGKSKSLNRMVYRLRARMENCGYSFEQRKASRPYYGREWDLEDELNDGDDEIDQTEYD